MTARSLCTVWRRLELTRGQHQRSVGPASCPLAPCVQPGLAQASALFQKRPVVSMRSNIGTHVQDIVVI